MKNELLTPSCVSPQNPYSMISGIEPVPPLPSPEEELAKQQERLRLAKREEVLTMIAKRSFDANHPIPKPTPRFLIAGKAVSTPGNLASIIAQAKSGKSAVIGALMGAFFVADIKSRNADFYGHDEPDTLGIQATPSGGKAVIHIDTEQSDYDHDRLVRNALKRARLTTAPDWFLSYRLAGLSVEELRDSLDALISINKDRGIFAIILDGSADFLNNMNDPPESNAFVAYLLRLAMDHHCSLVGVIHENPGPSNIGSGKGRGHFGSQLERKAESNICLKKSGETTVIYATKMRGAPIPENEGPCFQWSDETGMHVSVVNKVVTPTGKKRTDVMELAEEIFESRDLLTYTEMKNAIIEARGCSPRWAEKRINDMKETEAIRNAGGGKWAFAS